MARGTSRAAQSRSSRTSKAGFPTGRISSFPRRQRTGQRWRWRWPGRTPLLRQNALDLAGADLDRPLFAVSLTLVHELDFVAAGAHRDLTVARADLAPVLEHFHVERRIDLQE